MTEEIGRRRLIFSPILNLAELNQHCPGIAAAFLDKMIANDKLGEFFTKFVILSTWLRQFPEKTTTEKLLTALLDQRLLGRLGMIPDQGDRLLEKCTDYGLLELAAKLTDVFSRDYDFHYSSDDDDATCSTHSDDYEGCNSVYDDDANEDEEYSYDQDDEDYDNCSYPSDEDNDSDAGIDAKGENSVSSSAPAAVVKHLITSTSSKLPADTQLGEKRPSLLNDESSDMTQKKRFP